MTSHRARGKSPASGEINESKCNESMLSESVTRLVEEFAKLPGIGKKSAERLTYHVLRIHRPRRWRWPTRSAA